MFIVSKRKKQKHKQHIKEAFSVLAHRTVRQYAKALSTLPGLRGHGGVGGTIQHPQCRGTRRKDHLRAGSHVPCPSERQRTPVQVWQIVTSNWPRLNRLLQVFCQEQLKNSWTLSASSGSTATVSSAVQSCECFVLMERLNWYLIWIPILTASLWSHTAHPLSYGPAGYAGTCGPMAKLQQGSPSKILRDKKWRQLILNTLGRYDLWCSLMHAHAFSTSWCSIIVYQFLIKRLEWVTNRAWIILIWGCCLDRQRQNSTTT